jgi:hypothetical protein
VGGRHGLMSKAGALVGLQGVHTGWGTAAEA